MNPPTTAIVLSLSHIPRDGRVLRHCQALTAAGYRVIAIGLASALPTDPGSGLGPDAAVQHIQLPPLDWSLHRRLVAATALVSARGFPSKRHVLAMANRLPGVRALSDALDHVLRMQAAGQTLIVANDWTALPAALTAQRYQPVALHYDTHELAVEEHQHSLRWRLLFPPLVRVIEALGVARAHSVSCVSPAIAGVMARDYDLSRSPSVLMSVPDAPPLPPRPPSERITVLYHGLFTANRGIANLIASAGSWPAHMRLVLRGRATSPRLDRQLAELATPGMRTGRIVIEPLVAQSDVVAAAHSADLGVFLPDLDLRQNRLALPNKLFEYLFAGLAPIVPARTEMAALLTRRMAGIRLDDPSPTGLSRALAHLTADQIMVEKQAAHQAARAIYKEAQTRTLATIVAEAQTR